MLLSRPGITLMIWLIVFTILVTVIIVLRFWALRIKKRSLRPDDYMVVVAWVSVMASLSMHICCSQDKQVNTVALACVAWWAIANGLGAHTTELDEYELGVQFKVMQTRWCSMINSRLVKQTDLHLSAHRRKRRYLALGDRFLQTFHFVAIHMHLCHEKVPIRCLVLDDRRHGLRSLISPRLPYQLPPNLVCLAPSCGRILQEPGCRGALVSQH